MSHNTQQFTMPKEQWTQLSRYRKGEVTMVDVQKAPLRLRRRFRRGHSSTARAHPALARKALPMQLTARLTPKLNESQRSRAANQQLLNSDASRYRDVLGENLRQSLPHTSPMLPEDLL